MVENNRGSGGKRKKMRKSAFEFYPTPAPFTEWLLSVCREHGFPIAGRILEPCAGAGDIASVLHAELSVASVFQNDLDPQWNVSTRDATSPDLRGGLVYDWEVTNYPFSAALSCLNLAVDGLHSVATYHRATLREPHKTLGLGRSFFRDHPPTATLWCPRFAHMRSQKTGKWSTDSVSCVWSVWVPGRAPIGDIWPSDAMFDRLSEYTSPYRERVDALGG